MLEINIVITNVDELTNTEKNILKAIAGEPAVKVIPTETPKLEETKPTKVIKTVPKTKPQEITTKIEEVIEPEITEEIVDVEFDSTALNEYAKANAKPEYGPHYRAILKEYGVTKFKDIPNDKVAEAKDKLNEVYATVV